VLLLDFRLADEYESWQQHDNLATADEWVLGTDCFLGEVRFSFGGQDFGFGQAPVFSVARGLYLAVADGHPYFESFEVERRVDFEFRHDVVAVRSAEFDRTALRVALREFATRVVRDLGEKHPALLGNNIVAGLLDRIARDRELPPLVRLHPADPVGDRLSALLWSCGGLVGTSLSGVDVEVMPSDTAELDERPDLADFARPAFLAGGPADAVEGLARRAVRIALAVHGLDTHPAAAHLE
jgi:hypothetical protein